MKWNKQDLGRWQKFILEPFALFFFSPNICFHPLIKDEKRYFGEDSIFHEKNDVGFTEFPRFLKTPGRLFPSSHFWSSHLWYSSPSQPCSSTRGALATDSFSCFLPSPSLEFIIPIKNSFFWIFPSTEELKCCCKIELFSESSWWSFSDSEI